MIKIINFIRNIFRKNKDKVFVEVEKTEKVKKKRVGSKEQFKDKGEVLICRDCGLEFLLTSSEKNFYNKNELPLPKRCMNCRDIRKQQRSVVKNV